MPVRSISNLVLFAVVGSHVVGGAPADRAYPLTGPTVLADGRVRYRVAVVSDLDGRSASESEPYTWLSYLKRGHLTYGAADKRVSVEWDLPAEGERLDSHLSMAGRGMELSELVTYDGRLLTLDDKTGLVYTVENGALVPWVLVVAGDGHMRNGMKNEWATVKGSKLYVGSHGKETVTDDGQTVLGHSMMWVKEIDKNGGVRHLNWTDNFVKLRATVGIRFPGYMTHESCVWSDVHGRWFFLPRKESKMAYNHKADEHRASNKLLAATPDFDDIKVVNVGKVIPNHGYASFKFIPNTDDTVITAISTQEENNITGTFITAFTIDGEIIYPETKVSHLKFEGFEFI